MLVHLKCKAFLSRRARNVSKIIKILMWLEYVACLGQRVIRHPEESRGVFLPEEHTRIIA